MGAGWLLMTLFWIALIALIVWAVWRLTGERGERWLRRQRGDSALDVLDQRFARGEMDADAYRQARATLTQEARGPR